MQVLTFCRKACLKLGTCWCLKTYGFPSGTLITSNSKEKRPFKVFLCLELFDIISKIEAWTFNWMNGRFSFRSVAVFMLAEELLQFCFVCSLYSKRILSTFGSYWLNHKYRLFRRKKRSNIWYIPGVLTLQAISPQRNEKPARTANSLRFMQPLSEQDMESRCIRASMWQCYPYGNGSPQRKLPSELVFANSRTPTFVSALLLFSSWSTRRRV